MAIELLSKADACSFLSCTPKSIERYVSRGKLRVAEWIRPSAGGRDAPWFDVADLTRLRDELTHKDKGTEATEATGEPPSKALTLSKSALSKTTDLTDATLAGLLAVVSERASAPRLDELACRTVLTLDDAARLTGLGVGVIERAISDGQLVARAVGPRGARVVGREAVQAFALGLLAPEPPRRRRR